MVGRTRAPPVGRLYQVQAGTKVVRGPTEGTVFGRRTSGSTRLMT